MSVREVIDRASQAAGAFWATGDFGEGWHKGDWIVQAQGSTVVDDSGEHERFFIGVVGPTSRHGSSRADINVFPQDYVPPPETELEREIAATALSIPDAKSALIKSAHCSLFWPGERHTLAWTWAQIGVWALQRPWIRSPEDEAWVWTDCLVPVLSLSKAGRQVLEEGSLGYELQLALLTNYVNPHSPGEFRSYLRQTIRHAASREAKKAGRKGANRPHPLWDWDAFMAFLRQRRRRGHRGIVLDKRRRISFANEQVRQELMNEYATVVARRDLIARLSAKMVEQVAGEISEASARRQVRRWLHDAGGPEGVRPKFDAWLARKGRDKKSG